MFLSSSSGPPTVVLDLSTGTLSQEACAAVFVIHAYDLCSCKVEEDRGWGVVHIHGRGGVSTGSQQRDG